MLKDERQALVEAVKSNFQTQIFGNDVDLEAASRDGNAPAGFTSAVNAFTNANGGSATTDWGEQVQAYLKSLTESQKADWQTKAAMGTLERDTANAQSFRADLRRAKRRGLNGGLFSELAASGDLGAADRFAQMSHAQISAFERAYRARGAAATSVGRFAGDAQFAKKIDAQTKVFHQALHEQRETKHALHRLEKRMDHLNEIERNAPEKTGQAVGKAINNTVSSSERRG
jgi:hypothetical protein